MICFLTMQPLHTHMGQRTLGTAPAWQGWGQSIQQMQKSPKQVTAGMVIFT